jgi:hypothetical protein
MIDVQKITKEMTRSQMMETFGEPTAVGGTTRRHKTPMVYRYDQIEIAFGPGRDSTVFYVMDVGPDGTEHNTLMINK